MVTKTRLFLRNHGFSTTRFFSDHAVALAFKNFGFGKFLAPGVVRNGFLAKFHAGLTYFHNFSMDFLKIVIFDCGIG